MSDLIKKFEEKCYRVHSGEEEFDDGDQVNFVKALQFESGMLLHECKWRMNRIIESIHENAEVKRKVEMKVKLLSDIDDALCIEDLKDILKELVEKAL
ncbi:MAG: hypothetical protein KUG81_04150 [Gammaproteobacteria bacterium]|nr:hypothetical protein [Gammaproteobacteria bacterium]